VGPDCRTRETETCLTITGALHEVTTADPRWSRATIGEPVAAGR
jgi:hypothetical protein